MRGFHPTFIKLRKSSALVAVLLIASMATAAIPSYGAFFDVAGTSNTGTFGAGSTAVLGNPNVQGPQGSGFLGFPGYPIPGSTGTTQTQSSGFFGNPAVDGQGIIPPTGGSVPTGGSTGGGFFNSGGGSSFFGGAGSSGSVPIGGSTGGTPPVTGGTTGGTVDTNMVCLGSQRIDRATVNNMIDTGQIYSYLNNTNAVQRQQLVQLGVLRPDGTVDKAMTNTLIDSGMFACTTGTTGGTGGSSSSGGGFFGGGSISAGTGNTGSVSSGASQSPIAATPNLNTQPGSPYYNVAEPPHPSQQFNGLFSGLPGSNQPGTGSAFGFNELLAPQAASLLAAVAPAGEVAIGISDGTYAAAPGGTITMPIEIDIGTTTSTTTVPTDIGWRFNFDSTKISNLQWISDSQANVDGSCSQVSSGVYECAAGSLGSTPFSDGTIGTFRITISPSATGNSTSIQITNMQAENASGTSIPISASPAARSITINQGGSGDGNLVVVAYGDSLVRGVGASSGNDFASLLSSRIGVPIINAGVSGYTTADALANINNVLALNPDVVVLFIGGNDILQDVPQATIFNNIQQIVQRFQQDGATVVLMGIHGAVFRFDYETGYQQIAANTGAIYVPNVLQGIIGNPTYLADPIHPNNAGHILIADRAEQSVRTAIQIEQGQQNGPNLNVTCAANPQQAQVGTTIFWTASPTGGTGQYTYSWSGTDGLAGNFQQTSAAYTTQGTKTANVTVTSGTATSSASCTTQITSAPLAGSCAVSVNQVGNQYQVRWTAFALGGTGQFSYGWTGTDGLSVATSTVPSVDKIYTTPGVKTATATITSGGNSINLNCAADLPTFSTSSTPVVGSCVVSGPHAINFDMRWSATPTAGNYSYAWTGTDGLSASSTRDAVIRYTTPGRKSGTVTIVNNTVGSSSELGLTCEAIVASQPPGGGGGGLGCFIATAAFGTEMEPHVATLRKFRDEKLLTNTLGEKFVQTYYKVSPPIADVIRDHESLKAIVRTALKPFVYLAEESLD